MSKPEDKTILVVDDDEFFREYLGTTLRDAGFKVVFAADGKEALEKVEEKIPDFISLNLVMPRKSGIRFLHHLRRRPEWADIPFVIVTAHADDDLGRKDLEEILVRKTFTGPGIYIEKPLVPEHYVKLICEQLGVKYRAKSGAGVGGRASDAVTPEVYPYEYFITRLTEEVSRSRRYKHPLAILVMDVDRLRDINDEYGRVSGNEVLQVVARLIRQSLRSSDITFRYGEDEFAIILPETSLSGAEEAGKRLLKTIGRKGAIWVAERIRKKIELYTFTYLERDFRTTVSIGVKSVDFPTERINADEIISQAHSALNEARQQGGNRVKVSQA